MSICNKHPRPDFKREEFLLLDGEWDFEFDDKEKPLNAGDNFSLKINVPYVYQSELSNVKDGRKCDVIWYKKSFSLNSVEIGKRIFLNFGAVDYLSTVYVNNQLVGSHKGGYSSFKFDITDYILEGENVICLKVIDEFLNKSQPRGKQKWTQLDRFGCFYKEYSGIWQSVWLEFTGEAYIERFSIIPNVNVREIELEVNLNNAKNCILVGNIYFKDILIKSFSFDISEKNIKEKINIYNSEFPWEGVALWNVDTPNLYDIKISI